MAYRRHHAVDTRIVRIFNTYGPLMRLDDGRMIPNFISQALRGEALTVYGDGTQTRSIQYIDDLVDGIRRLMNSDEPRPVNIGNPTEYTVNDVAQMILRLCQSSSAVVHEPLPSDDPRQRCPDTSRAQETLGWTPSTSAEDGLKQTIAWFVERLAAESVS